MSQVPKKLQKLLDGHPVLQAVLRTANKTGLVLVSNTSMEKWNYPDGTGNEELEPRSDGHFDVEGHGAADVEASFDVRIGWSFFKAAILWLWELARDRDWQFSKVTSPFKKKWTNWLFVVDSFTSVSWEYAEEIVELTHPGLWRLDYKKYFAEVEKVQKGITVSQIGAYLKNKGYWMPRKGMFISPTDPTCFVCDDSFYGFDMKSGWSDKKIYKLVELWFTSMDYGYLPVVEEKRHENN